MERERERQVYGWEEHNATPPVGRRAADWNRVGRNQNQSAPVRCRLASRMCETARYVGY